MSTHAVCSDDPGCHGHSFPSFDRNSTAPLSHGLATRVHGSIRSASSRGGAPAVAVEAHPKARVEDMVASKGSPGRASIRSEEHTSELQSLMRSSYADFCFKKKKLHVKHPHHSSYILKHKLIQQLINFKLLKH